ncbi:ATP-grasp domain-containing protein [Spongiimicrobium salis]|uniref:ATP-grasp domain-containing protein n=1 Tax=Spongiimicrobium salis TaxID=1667022 RepID=UPI00374DC7A7
MNIMITSAGRRVSLIKAFQKELKKIAPEGKVFCVDANPKESAACHVADGCFEVPRIEHQEYISSLLQCCRSNHVKLIIPTIDTELLILAEHAAFFEEHGVKVIVTSADFVEKCRNKREIHKFFESIGIATAKEYTKTAYTLPVFIKPFDGSRSKDIYLIRKTEDFRSYHFENDKLMFLEYLDHEQYEEFTCDMYYDRSHHLRCVVPRKRIEVRDGEVNKGVTERNDLIPFLKEKMRFVPGALGCFTAQFFLHKTNGNVYGIEVNPRFGGGYPLSYLAGANFPKWIIEEHLMDKTIEDQFEVWEDQLLMLRYDDEILVHGYKG